MFKPFLIIILALAVVAAVVFVGGKYLGKEAADETAGWQTYRNKEYGFEIKYPSNWVVENSGYLIPKEFQNDKRDMMLVIEPVNIGRESVFDPSTKLNIVEINFAGKRALLYSCPDRNPCPTQFAYGKSIRLLEYPTGWDRFNEIDFGIRKGYEGLIEVYNQVLGSLTFTR